MVDLTANPATARDDFNDRLAEGRAWVVVFRDRTLADAFEAMAGGGLRGVILAPGVSILSDLLAGEELPDDTKAVAISARSGQIVDIIPVEDEVDAVRMFEAFVRAESM